MTRQSIAEDSKLAAHAKNEVGKRCATILIGVRVMNRPHAMNCLLGLVCGAMIFGACSSDADPAGAEQSTAGAASAGTKAMAGASSSAGKTGLAGSTSTAGALNGNAGSNSVGGSSNAGGETSGAGGVEPGITPGGTCKAFVFEASGGFTVDHSLEAADKCSAAAPNGGLVLSFIFGVAPDSVSCSMLGMAETGAAEFTPGSLECQKSPSIWSAKQPGQCKVALTTFTATTVAGDVTCIGALSDITAAAGGAGGADSVDGLTIETWTFEIAF